MKYTQLFKHDDLLQEIAEGYVRARNHPTLPLEILNYSEKAQCEQRWNAVTRNCRGLIVDDAGNVVSRPWPKFYNLGEHDGVKFPEVDLDAKCVTQDKLDGSLGILFQTPDGPAIATRGSFGSDQAKWATVWLRENFPDWKPDPRTTYLFEIVYDANRIVLNYDFEGLVLLGCHDTETYALRHDALWPGRRAAVLPPRTVREALAMPDRDNAEGVVCTVGTGPRRVMVKLKQSDYVERHRVVTGLSEKIIWEHLSAGWGVSSLVKDIPDEFHAWVDQVKDRLLGEFISIQETATRQWEIRPRGVHRSKFAEYAKGCDYPAIMFRWYDDKNADDIIWNMVKPKGDTRMVNNA